MNDADLKPEMDGAVKQSDIARLAKKSRATVSMALSNDPRISAETRLQVQQISERLGYQTPRSLKRASRRRGRPERDASGLLHLGFLANQRLDHPISAGILDALHQSIASHNIRLEIASIPLSGNSDALVDRAIAFGRGVDGLILMGLITRGQLARIAQASIPTVLYGYPLGGHEADVPVPTVTTDWTAMGRRATEILIEHGHRRIGFISGELHPGMWHDRCLDGYAIAHLHAGLPLVAKRISAAPTHQDAGSVGAQAMLALPKRPTAFVAINAGTASRFVNTMREAGVELGPTEMVVCGYEHLVTEFGVDHFPLIHMQPRRAVAAVIAQLRLLNIVAPVSHGVTLVPFGCRNTTPPAQATKAGDEGG